MEEFTRRISDALKQYPYLVLEDQGRLLGYTYAHPEREWKAYQWNAELSIYLAPAAVGKGYGRGCTKLCWTFCPFRASVPYTGL